MAFRWSAGWLYAMTFCPFGEYCAVARIIDPITFFRTMGKEKLEHDVHKLKDGGWSMYFFM